MFYSDLDKIVFFNPVRQDVNRLCILVGYATPNMASWLIKNMAEKLNKTVEISLIVGMIPYDGLSISVHEGFKELQNDALPDKINKFTCSYIYNNPPVNSKLYIWLKNNKPVMAYTGSPDFTQNAFSRRKRENLIDCDPVEAYEYYCTVEKDSIYCNHSEVEDCVVLHSIHPILDMENKPLESFSGMDIDKVSLPLVSNKTGEPGAKSGLNWGQRKNRNRNQAYIPLPVDIARSGFFPLEKQHFTVVTDDQHQLILRVEQENNKAIATPLSNAQLGEYFRNRLGLANGAFIKRSDLEKYGRTDVTFYKLDDEHYYMDFSVK